MTNTADDGPEFDFNFADIPDTEPKDAGPKAKKIESTKKELQQVLNLEDNNDWLEWLRSGMVRPWWEELWNNHLSQEQSKERGKGIGVIQNRILSGEAHGVLKYSSPQPNKEDWDGADHLARFHLNVKNMNLRSREGVFYGKNLSDDTMDKIVWALKGWLCKIHAPSYISKPHGGTAVLGTKRQGEGVNLKRKAKSSDGESKAKKVKDDHNGTGPSTQGPTAQGTSSQATTTQAITAQATTSQATTAQATTSHKDIDSKGSDDDDDEEDDGDVPSLTASTWKTEMLNPRQKILLEKKSDVFDDSETYWKFRHIVEALKYVQLAPAAATTDAIILTDDDADPTSEENTEFEPPSTADNASGLASTFDGSKYADASELESELSGHIDTRDFKSGIIVPTEESLEQFRLHQKVFDNLLYQRENHREACVMLNIKNPEKPRMRSMNRGALLQFWQPTAIAGLLEVQAKGNLRGAVLGDTVGLGKTWEAVGFILKLWEDYNDAVIKAQESGSAVPRGRPFLIVVPPSLIMQWVAEIAKISSKLRVLVYYGDVRGGNSFGVSIIDGRLSASHKVFNGKPVNGRTVIITSYQTLNSRHGPAAVKTWLMNKRIEFQEPILSVPAEFPHDLRGCFATVVLDEAHTLRNAASNQSRAVTWLCANFHLLLSATLIFNSIEDFRGYMPFLFTIPSLWSTADWKALGINSNTDVFGLPDHHPGKSLCCTVEAVEKYILLPSVAPPTAGSRLRTVLAELMIRRTLLSRIPFDSAISIGADIPPLQRKVIDVTFNDIEAEEYKKFSLPHKRGLFIRSQLDPNKYVWNMKKLRKLVLLTSWLGFHFVESALKAESIPMICSKLHTGHIAKAFMKGIKGGTAVDKKTLQHFFETAKDDAAPRRTLPLEFLLRGSPKLRSMIGILRDQVLIHHEKAIIWTMFPAEQVFIGAALVEANIDAKVFHASLGFAERASLIHEFTTERDKCMALVCSFSVNAAGLNLQQLCRNVHLFSEGTSKSVVDQAIGRVCRLGQQKVVLVYDYQVEKSFDMTLVLRNKIKAIPALVAQMRGGEFLAEAGDDQSAEGPSLGGKWVVRNGKAYCLQNDEQPQPEDKTSPDDVLPALVDLVTSQ